MSGLKNETIIKEYEQCIKSGKSATIALCNYQTLPPLHQLIINKVQLDPETDIFKPAGSNAFALHLSALEALGDKAGIKWDPPKIVTTRTTCLYTAYGYYIRELNEPSGWQGLGFCDLDDVREDLIYEYEAKAKTQNKDQSYVDYCVNRDFMVKRRKKVQLAAAEAHGQVLRKVLKIGKTYPKALFNHPIVIIRCVMVPDLNDPATVAAINIKAIDSAVDIYGPGSTRMIPKQLAPFGDHEAETIIPEHIPEDEEAPPEGDPRSEEETDSQRTSFMDADKDAQLHALSTLISRKDYEMPTVPKTGKKATLVDLGEENRLKLYDALVGLDDVDPEPDDIPF